MDRRKMESSKIVEIKSAERSVTRAQDSREDLQLILASHLNCQSMLTTAPMTVAVLGHLTLVTSHKDVSLHMQTRKYECIKYPESLRASTVQLANEGWTAFNLAEKNMDQIRLYTGQVPSHVKSAVKLMICGTKMEIKTVLPNYLEAIKNIAAKCVSKANEVEKQFEFVFKLTKELQEACVLTQGGCEKKITDASQEAENKKRQAEAASKAEKDLVLAREEMKQQLHDAKQKYDEQVKAMPGAVKLVGMAVADSVCKVIAAPGNLIKGFSTLFKGKTSQETTSQADIEGFISFVTETTRSLQRHLETNDCGDAEIENMKQSLESQLSSLQLSSGPMKERLESIYRDGIDVTTKMLDSRQGSVHDELSDDLSKMQDKTQAAILFFQTLSRGLPMIGQGPRLSTFDNDGPFDAYVKQAHFKVESAQHSLTEAKSDFEKMTVKLEKTKNQNLALLCDLSKVQLDKTDFEEIENLLRKCMGALADIRVQWSKLVNFFQTLSNLIECELHTSLEMFRKSISERDSSMSYGFSDAMLDIIYQQTAQTNGVAIMCCDLSGMYLEISQQHLTEPLAGLGKLLELDPRKDKEMLEHKQKDLTGQCINATDEVGEYITKKKDEFDGRVGSRLERINAEMMTVLPPKPTDDPETARMKKEAIEEAQGLRRQHMRRGMEQFH